ncbi:isocitrate/isopropylmalate dehydrogenase family protein [Streptomyces griseoruber]|uniref:isocitrate/isopropylmalate dehydrogenase family protein n=1 Tax=Streptomyces griseoruber TaxID=1943 RepID=UPI0007C6E792|nr:isocitrate/isopropylmalate family dehydrogenase [Streptomyces griseoruber]
MRIAVVPGDGIGQEVIPATLPALTALSEAFGLGIDYDVFDWGADQWLATGTGLPPGAIDRLARDYGAVFLGALGDPRIPDMAHGRDILLGLRKGLDLYVNHRPIVLEHGVIDLYRENTQGLYAGVGGSITRSGTVTVAIDECVYTRETVERFVRFCLARLRRRGHRKVTLVHKSNAVPNTGTLWQDVFRRELEAFPELTGSEEYVDSFCYHLVRDPTPYEGVLASNLFGDIISDIGAALMGGLGLAASASICPESDFALFEPVHGSAPDIAGKGTANPYAAAMSLGLLLDHFGHADAAALLRSCVTETAGGEAATPDLGGKGGTQQFMDQVMTLLEQKL